MSLQEPLLGGDGSTMVPPGQLRVNTAPEAQGGAPLDDQDPTCWESCCSLCGAPRQAQAKPLQGQVKGGPNLLALDLASPEGAAFAQLAGGLWVSHILQRLWPSLSASVEAMVLDMVPGLLEASTPKWMEGVTLDKFELGNQPPNILNVHVDQVDDDDVAEVRLHLEVAWSSQSDIQLTIKPLPAILHQMMPGLLQAMMQFMTSLTVGVQGLSVRAQVLLTLAPLSSELPVVKAMHVSMLRPPTIDYNITLTKGESTILNVVKPWLRSIISSCFTMYVMPEVVHVPIAAGVLPVQKPEGVVVVQVVRATDVPKMDYWGHSDTYCDVYVRSRIRRRTPVVKKSANPEWPASDASFTFLVHARQYQSLVLELWDADDGMLDNTDDAIGHCTLSLASLQPGKELTLALPVLNATTKHLDAAAVDLATSPAAAPAGSDDAASASATAAAGALAEDAPPSRGALTPTSAADKEASLLPPGPGGRSGGLLGAGGTPGSGATPRAGGSAGTPGTGSGRGTPTVAAGTPGAAAFGAHEVLPHMARHGIDPGHACARSTADVANTRVHVVVRYVPASLAPLMGDDLASVGVFNLKLSKVTVPDLALLPLRARAYITGQRPAANPPTSYVLRPLRGKDKVTGEDLSDRKEIPYLFDAVWDVLGTADDIAQCTFVLELVRGLGTASEEVATSVDMPVQSVIDRRITTMAGGVAGGDYKLKSQHGFVFDMLLLWAPLVDKSPPDAPAGESEPPPALQHSATTPAHGSGTEGTSASFASASSALHESVSMPAEMRKASIPE